ncbi:CDP-alcohol phosphatidyltransferase family protein [Pararoseomonas sp. SCSIO 73927]|uniref:CDP-alcohol phosphatidyltransferase family protein n=1 Tax=Pararoseomonas sp. SCSIO 73927 TaxID=3114537 RepID=UPI0030D06AF6
MPVWSMPGSELLRRALIRAGVADAAPWAGDAPAGALLLLRADQVYDASLVKGLAGRPGALLLRPEDGLPVAAHLPAGAEAAPVAAALLAGRPAGDPAFAGLVPARPTDLADLYNKALRKRGNPYLLRLNAGTRGAVEWEMFGGSYKGVTDAITKHVWPRPAFQVVRACAALGITPNMVTFASLILVFVALWLFAIGSWWPGLLAAWVMTFLDTVDGKLARVTLTSTPLGNVFDHAIDLIHPPFWWLAWILGLSAAGMPLAYPVTVGVIVFGGYVAQRLQEGLFLGLYRMEIHVWRRFDSFFRLWIARRNPNLLILSVFTLFGRPDWGMLALAAWTVFGCLEQVVVTVQAGLARRRAPLRSWLEG